MTTFLVAKPQLTAFLTQSEYKTFQRKVEALKSKGFELDFDVFQPNKRKVKVVLNQQYDFDELDRLSGTVV